MGMLKAVSMKECIAKIRGRIRRHKDRPGTGSPTSLTVVNVNNSSDLKRISFEFSHSYDFVHVSELAADGAMPTIENILQRCLSCTGQPFFIEGVSAHARLFGRDTMKKTIEQVMGLPYSDFACIVVVLYQCEDLLCNLYKKDLRLGRNIILVEGDRQTRPEIIFLSKDLDKIADVNGKKIYDIKGMLKNLERTEEKQIFVLSQFSKKDFPHSEHLLRDMTSYFEMLCSLDTIKFTDEDKDLLSDTEWRDFTVLCIQKGGMDKYFSEEFGQIQRIDDNFYNWYNYSKGKKILLFLYARLHPNRIKGEYLKFAIGKCKKFDGFLATLYNAVLDFPEYQAEDWNQYETRKSLLRATGATDKVAEEFCNLASGRGFEALSLLTDLTAVERKKIVSTVSLNWRSIPREKILDVLQHVYSDLYDYLIPFDYGIEEMSNYFNEYKWLKVGNTVTESFSALVEREARERSYNRILPARSEKLERLKTDNSIVYFVDALGSEYMSYIYARAKKMNLFVKAEYCRSSLPSITEYNNNFVQFFKDKGVPVKDDVKGLDNIIHEGTQEYDYTTNSKAPTYLVDQFAVIDQVLQSIDKKISGAYKKAFIVSDHGATRLAIVGFTGKRWEFVEKGCHGGRCCKASEEDSISVDCVTKENGYWVIANYDTIKGGRIADFEVHGGATWEEMCIPIIEFSRRPLEEIIVNLMQKEIVINRLNGACPSLRFSVNVVLENVKVRIGDGIYDVEKENGTVYAVPLDKAYQKSGAYSFDILSDGNVVKEGIEFSVRSKMMKQNNLFDD